MRDGISGGVVAWRAAWAKWPSAGPGERQQWLPLHAHLTDAGLVSGRIWDDWLGPGARSVIVADAGGSQDRARQVVMLAAVLHDIGKCTPVFAGQVPAAKVAMEVVGFRWPRGAVRADSRALPHALAGQILVEAYLRREAIPWQNARAFAVVIGGHHGVPPNDSELADALGSDRLLGDGEWGVARAGLIEHLLSTLDLTSAVQALRDVRLSDASQMLITAIVVMADWIASNPDYFPLVPAGEDVFADPSERGERGWRTLGLPPRWQATDEALTANASQLLRTRCGIDAQANDVQRLAVRAAREMPEAGLLIIEAVMGAGKSEAALLAAEILAHRFGRSGLFYGLPTRATADGMFPRALTWWANVPGGADGEPRGVSLRHSSAWLNPEFRGLPRTVTARDGSPEGSADGPLSGNLVDVGRDVPETPTWDGRARSQQVSVVVHRWTSGRKRASFADTVVATIDHELLAALTTRHVVLRHLGLARQVVILDEVHASDSWMRIYLERALMWLGRYGTPVIILSATLPPAQRQALVDAYEQGRRAGVPREPGRQADPIRGLPKRRRRAPRPLPQVPDSARYPLVTTLSGGVATQTSAAPPPPRSVAVRWVSDSLENLSAGIGPVTAAGGCVLVVCNTVSRAIDRYRHLAGEYGDRVTLAHSRFVAADRVAKDEWLRTTFGPGNGDRAGRVVVATQVAEQSLDVDFDLLVTDLAPVDLVLQRIGRLHRHSRPERPEAASTALCLVTGLANAPTEAEPPGLDSGGARVYGAHLLYRTAALLDERVRARRPLTLPDDVPRLVRDCYGDDEVGPGPWQAAMAEAKDRYFEANANDRSQAEQYCLRRPGERPTVVGMLNSNVGEAETSAGATKQVRKDDGGFEVILVVRAQDGLRLLAHLDDGRGVPTDVPPDRDTVRRLAQSMVRIPGWVTANPRQMDEVLDQLTQNYYPAWQRDPVLAGQLVLPLDPDGTSELGPFLASYDTEVGLEVSHG